VQLDATADHRLDKRARKEVGDVTAQGILGEVLPVGKRLCTPSTALWIDGDAIDAGTAMILDSNLSQQARESLHQLGCALGPGLLVSQSQVNEFAYLLDQETPTNAPSQVRQVSWSQARTMCFGPYDITPDRRTTDGTIARGVVVSVDCDASTTTSLVLYAAVTQGPAIPTDTTFLGFARVPVTTASRTTVEISLGGQAVAGIVRRGQQNPSEMTTMTEAYVWLAWRATGESDYLYAVSVYEVR
jgi:hypothetical protein